MTDLKTPPASPWPAVGLLYLCGLFAAVQLGKFSALAPLMAVALGLSLPAVAVAISLVEAGGATLGSMAGRLADRLGLHRALRAGLLALAVAGLGEATAPGAAALFAWRLLEAAGYLGVIVSAPVLIVRGTTAAGVRTQAMALTLWSTFVPVGIALGAWASAALAQPLGWRAAVLAWAGVGAVLAAVVWWRGPRASVPAARPVREPSTSGTVPVSGATPVGVWTLALGFGGFAIFEVGMLGLLPTLLVRQAGMAADAAGRWTAIASLSAVAGSALAAWLLRRGMGLRWPCMVSLGLPPLLLFAVFTPAPVLPWALAAAVALNALGGIFASLAFALLPRVAPDARSLVRGNGWIAQCGASGSLLGPPLMAGAVQVGGWHAAAVLGLVVSALALPLIWRATATPPRQGGAST